MAANRGSITCTAWPPSLFSGTLPRSYGNGHRPTSDLIMTSGRHNDYYWIEWHGVMLYTLLHRLPDIVLDRYLINTSFDSGRLTLSDEERQQGWHSDGWLTYSPRINDVQSLPYHQFDEWLVFPNPTELDAWEPFVNYAEFSLVDTRYDYDEIREELWRRMENVRPESYLAAGDRLIYITIRRELFELARDIAEPL